MKIAQFRRVLDTVAAMHEKADRPRDADVLRKLAAALKTADKEQVSKVVDKLCS